MDKGKDQFFAAAVYMVHVTGWPEGQLQPEEPVEAPGDARLAPAATTAAASTPRRGAATRPTG